MGHDVKIVAPCSYEGEMLDRDDLIVMGRPISVPASGSVARIALSLRMSRRAKDILQREQFDVVHLHEPLVPFVPITMLRFSRSINVGTFHASHRKSRSYYYARRLLKRWFHKLDGKIAVSRPAADFVGRYFPGYYNIIPNGIDIDHFSDDVAPIEAYRDGRLNLLFVGRLEKRKGLRYLLGAYSLLKREHPDLRLLVVGPGGRAWADYRRLVEKHGLRDVVFVGYVSYEELPRYYRTADIFCAPATGGESFGIVLLEAMAAGKPVVASNIEGYASVMQSGVQGLLVPPKDEYALAGALSRLLSDKDLREEMGARGREEAEKYSWPHVSQQVYEYYERLLNQGEVVSA
jgi:phosphatidylinositol alpha-mannosyltransferase